MSVFSSREFTDMDELINIQRAEMNDFLDQFPNMERQELDHQNMEKITGQTSEINDFLDQFSTRLEKRNLDQTLAVLKENVNAIRTRLENKPKRVTLLQIDRKLDLILKILSKNGMKSE